MIFHYIIYCQKSIAKALHKLHLNNLKLVSLSLGLSTHSFITYGVKQDVTYCSFIHLFTIYASSENIPFSLLAPC